MSATQCTELEEGFARHYTVDLNAAAAYRRIKPNVKESTARNEGAKLLAKPCVQDRIRELKREQFARLQISADRVLQELAIIGFSDTGDYVLSKDGSRLELAAGTDPSAARALASVKHKTRHFTRSDGTRETIHEIEYKLWDKPSALRALGEHLKLFKPEAETAGCEIILGQGEEVRLIVRRNGRL